MKVKMFVGIQEVEKKINNFLSDNPGIEIIQISQSESSASIQGCYDQAITEFNLTITIFYK